jgi:hypothetical protein
VPVLSVSESRKVTLETRPEKAMIILNLGGRSEKDGDGTWKEQDT